MKPIHIGIEAFNLSYERRAFARGGFTMSRGRVAEHAYRGLLFNAPEEWRYELLTSGPWRSRGDEAAAFERHRARVHPFFVPPALPLINARVQAAWQRYGHPALYAPYVRKQSYSLLQYTSELPWGDRPLAPIECVIAHDFYEALVDPAQWRHIRKRLLAHRDTLWMTAVSDFTRREAIELLGLPPERVRTIHNAVDHAVYRPEPGPDDAATLAKWNVPPSYALYVGSVAVRKNVMPLVQAMEKLQQEGGQPLALVIAGNVLGASYRIRRRVWQEIKEAARRTPIVQIQHPTDAEMACLYRHARVMVHPSLFEGFGIPVLEAMACGTPAVCGRHSALIEVGGDAVRFVEDCKDPAEWATAVGEAASSDGVRAGLRSRGLAQAAKFSWERFEADYVRFYRDVLAA